MWILACIIVGCLIVAMYALGYSFDIVVENRIRTGLSREQALDQLRTECKGLTRKQVCVRIVQEGIRRKK